MQIPDPDALIERLRAMPAAAVVLDRLSAEPVSIVGGAVRDVLLGRGAPVDLDLVVDGPVAPLVARLSGTAVAYDRFGTATVLLDGQRLDVARARRERYPAPGALPEVEPADIEEDLLRRDFTVNALAVAPTGALIAPPHALADLAARQLRVLHADSFRDDPTRLLRLARYQARLRFEVEPATLALAREAVRVRALETVSGPRIGNELRLLALESDPIRALAALSPLGLDAAIAPGFGLHAGGAPLARAALELLPSDGRRDLVVLAIAARHVPADELPPLLDRLGFESGERETIVAAATRAPDLAAAMESADRASELAAAVQAAGAAPELVALAGALGPLGPARRWLTQLRHVKLAIDGGDLLGSGIPQGPAIGQGLRAAMAAVLDGTAAGREQQLAAALAAARATD